MSQYVVLTNYGINTFSLFQEYWAKHHKAETSTTPSTPVVPFEMYDVNALIQNIKTEVY
jgi:hypothetical protein